MTHAVRSGKDGNTILMNCGYTKVNMKLFHLPSPISIFGFTLINMVIFFMNHRLVQWKLNGYANWVHPMFGIYHNDVTLVILSLYIQVSCHYSCIRLYRNWKSFQSVLKSYKIFLSKMNTQICSVVYCYVAVLVTISK